jgi:hypothetical protein
MVLYLIKSVICLLVLLLFHRFVLQKEGMYHVNRFYLLFSVVASFLIPFNTIEVSQVELPVGQMGAAANNVAAASFGIEPVFVKAEKSIDWMLFLTLFYVSITSVFLIRFVRNICILLQKVKRNILIKYRGENLVMLKEDCSPFSFLKYIFVSRSDFESGKFTDAILIHESTHVKGKHSWDNLFIEILLVFFWFHPALYWAKESIKLNHEFIADQAALKIIPIEKYKIELLSMILSGQKFDMASSLNFSLTKKRFEMMKRQTKGTTQWIKVLALVPLIGGLVYFLSDKVTAQNSGEMKRTLTYVKNTEDDKNDYDINLTILQNGEVQLENKIYSLSQIDEILNQIPKKKGGLIAKVKVSQGTPMGYVSDWKLALFENGVTHMDFGQSGQKPFSHTSEQDSKKDIYYSNSTFIVEDNDGNKTKKSYSQLTESEKAGLPEPPTIPEKVSPSSETFLEWKNSEKFAVWLDGLNIPNKKLDEMDASEIVHTFSSFVHNNARSERFPQPYQIHLYTDNGFEKSFGPDSDFEKPLSGVITLKSKNPE